MSKKKSGSTTEDRHKDLQELGFVPRREGEGSHGMWEHPALKMLARSHKIEAPINLLATPAQKPWDMLVCDNPAKGTWNAMMKQARWCHETVGRIEKGAVYEQQRLELARQFRKAAGEYKQWKSNIRQWAKTGLDMADAPAPPLTFKDLMALKTGKNRLPNPAR